MRSIDINADVGEGCASDGDLIALVTSINIACGAHAGDPDTMRRTISLALRHGVGIGAHPGFADREHFGRREISVAPEHAGELVVEQVRRLAAIAAEFGASVRHVKLHGALYNMAARDPALALGVAAALAEEAHRTGTTRVLVVPCGSVLAEVARERGLPVLAEAFADRAYREDGSLVPRSEPGSVLGLDQACAQALDIVVKGRVRTALGTEIDLRAETICIHGDSPGAASLAGRLRAAFESAHVSPQALNRKSATSPSWKT